MNAPSAWHKRALGLALLVAVLPAAKCVLSTEMISDAFNAGAIDTSGGDPFRDPKNVMRDIVEARILAELVDAYYHMGDDIPGKKPLDFSVSDWMTNVANDIPSFYQLVTEVACAQKIRIGETCPRTQAEPAPVQQLDPASQSAHDHLIVGTAKWAKPRPERNVCVAKNQRDDEALGRFLDYLRFTVALERAVHETADLLAEGIVDKEAVFAGAERAFKHAAKYLEQRRWRRDLNHRTAGLVVKGGAATGTYSAGVVWVALNLIDRYIEYSRCDRTPSTKSCPRFDLVSGTSTGAFVAAAVDRFGTATDTDTRKAMIRTIAEWFTCFALNDMYCAQERSLTNILSPKEPLQGVLKFDGLREILSYEIAPSELDNPTELVLNTVDFRSGRLYALSDQNRADMRVPGDVVNGVLASAVLPVIVEPIPALPISPTAGEVAVYLDGGIRSELPVLPLVRRGAERVLIASSGPSVLGETSRLPHGLAIALRYLDISTGGVTEGELEHAKRHVESVRLAEAIQCRDMLWRNRPKDDPLNFTSVCPKGKACERSQLCAGQYQSAKLCANDEDKEDETAAEGPLHDAAAEAPPAPASEAAAAEADEEPSKMSPALVAPRLQIRELWKLVGVFRDERTVDPVHGYDFNANDQRRLFLAGAEAARRRCREIADLLGISGPGVRAELPKWCSPKLTKNLCSCYIKARWLAGETKPGIRVCGDAPPQTSVILDECSARSTKPRGAQ
jgi:predicted acylesterase/phospholipase RssA